MRVKCYSVRLESFVSISDKAYKATCFDGTTDIIPKSQVFGRDWDVMKSEAWWISAWILEKKNLPKKLYINICPRSVTATLWKYMQMISKCIFLI